MNITDLIATLKLARKTMGDIDVLVQDADIEGTPVAIAGLDKSKGGVVLRYHTQAVAKPETKPEPVADAPAVAKPKAKATKSDT